MRIKEHPILDFPEKRRVRFTFEEQQMYGYDGEPIAAALHDNGIAVLRYSLRHNRPRGFFCAIGKCSSCLMEVNGVPNIRTCVVPLKKGMAVKRQKGKGKIKY